MYFHKQLRKCNLHMERFSERQHMLVWLTGNGCGCDIYISSCQWAQLNCFSWARTVKQTVNCHKSWLVTSGKRNTINCNLRTWLLHPALLLYCLGFTKGGLKIALNDYCYLSKLIKGDDLHLSYLYIICGSAQEEGRFCCFILSSLWNGYIIPNQG